MDERKGRESTNFAIILQFNQSETVGKVVAGIVVLFR
jgi:hypothetical protein